MKNSDHSGMCPIERANNTPLRAPIVAYVRNFHEHAVPVHSRTDRVRRNENVSRKASLQIRRGRSEVRDHKSESIAVKRELSRNEVFSGRGLRNRIPV